MNSTTVSENSSKAGKSRSTAKSEAAKVNILRGRAAADARASELHEASAGYLALMRRNHTISEADQVFDRFTRAVDAITAAKANAAKRKGYVS